MVYKCTHGLASEYLQDRFVNHVSNYFLRDSSNKFDVPLPAQIILKIVFVIAGGLSMERFAFNSSASRIHTQF